MRRWRGRIAVVANAARGIGHCAAIELGRAGVFVYALGRTLKPGCDDAAGSLDETVEAIRRAGGDGHAVACDCANHNALEQLFAEVEARHRRLDILVNSAFPAQDVEQAVGKRIWETDAQTWSEVVDLPGRAAYFATALAAPLLIASAKRKAPGLIVNLSGPRMPQDRATIAHGVGRSAIVGLTRDAATELKAHHVAVVALQLGLDGGARAETAQDIGRCIAALAADEDRMGRTGQTFRVSTLMTEYALGGGPSVARAPSQHGQNSGMTQAAAR
jgi:NAD(P)-dependent dehydrogenase (short-subunit alcohol dehydrogenase family)